MLRNNSYSESKTQDSKEIMTSIKNSPQPVPLVSYPITCELYGPHLHSSLCRASDLYRCMPARPHLLSEPLETQSQHFQVETHFLASQAAFFWVGNHSPLIHPNLTTVSSSLPFFPLLPQLPQRHMCVSLVFLEFCSSTSTDRASRLSPPVDALIIAYCS